MCGYRQSLVFSLEQLHHICADFHGFLYFCLFINRGTSTLSCNVLQTYQQLFQVHIDGRFLMVRLFTLNEQEYSVQECVQGSHGFLILSVRKKPKNRNEEGGHKPSSEPAIAAALWLKAFAVSHRKDRLSRAPPSSMVQRKHFVFSLQFQR